MIVGNTPASCKHCAGYLQCKTGGYCYIIVDALSNVDISADFRDIEKTLAQTISKTIRVKNLRKRIAVYRINYNANITIQTIYASITFQRVKYYMYICISKNGENKFEIKCASRGCGDVLIKYFQRNTRSRDKCIECNKTGNKTTIKNSCVFGGKRCLNIGFMVTDSIINNSNNRNTMDNIMSLEHELSADIITKKHSDRSVWLSSNDIQCRVSKINIKITGNNPGFIQDKEGQHWLAQTYIYRKTGYVLDWVRVNNDLSNITR